MKKTAAALILSLAVQAAAPVCMAEEYDALSPNSIPYELPASETSEGEGIKESEYTDEKAFDMPECEEAYLNDNSTSEPKEIVYINTADDLKELRINTNTNADYTSGKKFILTHSLDLGGTEWEPIGYNPSRSLGNNQELLSYTFKGEFDGNGHTIQNFKMTASDHTYLGFFGTLNTAAVKNLTLSDFTLSYNGTDDKALEYAGGLAAFSNYSTIENCRVSGTINVSFEKTGVRIMAGMLTGTGLAKISGCTVSGSVTTFNTANAYAGGIQGYISDTTYDFAGSITNCTSNVSISSDSNSTVYNGGITGRSSYSMTEISDCTYSGSSKSLITSRNSLASGSSTGYPIYSAGIAAYNYCLIKNCRVKEASITAESPVSQYVGAIVGRNLGIIDGCASDADLKAVLIQSKASATPFIGGITGSCGLQYNTAESLAPVEDIPAVRNCTVSDKASIDISAADVILSGAFVAAGGIAGSISAPCSIENSVAHISGMKIKTGTGIYSGGICGYLNGGRIERCISDGKMGEEFSPGGTLYIGGIAGDSKIKSFLTYDTSHGVVSPELITTKIHGSSISECSSAVDLTASANVKRYAGGISGYVTGQYSSSIPYVIPDTELQINKSSYRGNILLSDSGNSFCGGIAGNVLDGNIHNSYAAGIIEYSVSDNANAFIGGGIGLLQQNDHTVEKSTCAADNSYADMALLQLDGEKEADTGAFIANIIASSKTNIKPSVSGCYYFSENTEPEHSGTKPLSRARLQEQSSFEGWDFEKVWEISGASPSLRFERTAIYESGNGTMIISRPQLNSVIYAAAYKDGQLMTAHSIRLDPDLIQSEAFTEIPFEFEAPSGNECFIYFWSGNQEPFSDKTNIEDLNLGRL